MRKGSRYTTAGLSNSVRLSNSSPHRGEKHGMERMVAKPLFQFNLSVLPAATTEKGTGSEGACPPPPPGNDGQPSTSLTPAPLPGGEGSAAEPATKKPRVESFPGAFDCCYK